MSAPGHRNEVSLPATGRKLAWPLAASFAFFLAALLICPWIGPTRIDVHDAVFGPPGNNSQQILLTARAPRILLAAMAGAALALAGVGFQAMLRNPLADPYTLGIAAGGSLGAVIAIRSGIEAGALGAFLYRLGISPLPAAAFAGCLVSVALVYFVASGRGQLPPTTMVLAGVIVSFFMSSIIMFLLYWRTDFVDAYQIMRWTMGSLEITSFGPVGRAAVFFAIGSAALLALARPLNLLATGEALAHSRGVHVRRVKQLVFVGASIVTASVISLSGPIGFIGIIVPHAIRMMFGADHRLVMPCSLLGGAGFLIVCDTACRTLMAPIELPVGVLTALLGGPFFIWLLRREKRQSFR
jgi:iron complex transport system permease protein